IEFTLRDCRARKSFPSIYFSVHQKQETACEVAAKPGPVHVQSAWRYGLPMDGYRTSGACEPLRPGQEYYVSPGGHVDGMRRFQVDLAGNAHPLEPMCP